MFLEEHVCLFAVGEEAVALQQDNEVVIFFVLYFLCERKKGIGLSKFAWSFWYVEYDISFVFQKLVILMQVIENS